MAAAPTDIDRARSHRRPKRQIGLAVVGLGYWGPNLVRNIQDMEDATLECVCDIDPSAVERVRRRYPGTQGTEEFASVLADPRVDAVAIATPISTHHALAKEALNAGKHVLVEKPLAASSTQVQELMLLAEERGLTLMPGHTFLYSPAVNAIRELIVSGELGDVYFISTSRVNLGLHQSDVSVVWDLAPHDFSILRYWLDETAEYVSAISRSCIIADTPDVAFVNLEYGGGAIAHVELSWLAPSKLRRTAIVGSKKMIVYDDTNVEPVRIFDSGVMAHEPESFGEFQLSYRTGDILSPRLNVVEPLAAELGDFCASIRSGDPPRSSAFLGQEVVRLIEAVDKSLNAHSTRVAVERDSDS